MHEFEFPDYVIERVMAKRGRLRVFDEFPAPQTALVVIDMQHFYVAEVATAKGIVPNINRLADSVREQGGTVVWACMTAGAGDESLWPIYHDHFFTEEKGRKHRESLTEGAPGHALWPELDARPEDTYVFKNRFSAFIQGACGLDEQLRTAGIENLLITGTATNFCCETSARDAMMLGYRVVMVSDGCAARYDEDHAVGLTSVFQSFGDVMTTDQVIDDLLVAAQPAEPAAP
jgi:nicotinamidase-related amidase